MYTLTLENQALRHLTKRKQFYRDANCPYAQERVEWQ